MENPPANSATSHLIGFPLPWITENLTGTSGCSKVRAEDFVVEEISAYAPQESGEFLFLRIEKAGISAEQLVSHLARCLKIAHQDVGIAGMKDRQAVTRQMVSVPARCQPLVDQFEHEQIRILEVHRHPHKLRTGHLKGNRFSILIRDVAQGALEKAHAIGTELARTGVPNFFGEQRFGRDAETLALGLELLQGTKTPGAIPRARRKFLLRLALSAVQSALFNRALSERMREGLIHRVQSGDVMQVVASGGPFVVEDAEREQSRFDAREIVISGPLFGPKMKPPAGEPAAREERLLADARIPREAFERFANLTPGTRRPYLIWPEDLRISGEPDGVRLEFTLPSGSYATVVLREFQKTGSGSI
jgi:tRNA pseudouridine13 synthase